MNTYKFARLRPEVHKQLKTKAAQLGLSINAYLEEQFKDDFDMKRTKKNEKTQFGFKW